MGSTNRSYSSPWIRKQLKKPRQKKEFIPNRYRNKYERRKD